METQNRNFNQVPNSYFSSPTSKKLSVVAGLVVVSLAYQNFTFSDGFKMNLIPVNERARAHHARELLGKSYSGSPAQMVENANSLGMAIFNDVYRSLPKKFKSHAVELASAILNESENHEIDPVFVMAVIKTESSFNPLARGSAGEIGLMQLKPDTAKWIAQKFKIPWKGPKTLENPRMNVRIGIAYLDYLRDRFDGHALKYVSAYNMGVGKVCRMYAEEKKPQDYSLRVMKNYRDAYRRLAAATTLSLIAGN